MSIGPACPTCATRVPFRRTQWRRGRAFDCAGCGASLIVPKAYWALGMIALYALLRDRVEIPGGNLVLLFGLTGAALLIELLLMRPRLAPAT